jgi:hypothetical protein
MRKSEGDSDSIIADEAMKEAHRSSRLLPRTPTAISVVHCFQRLTTT